MKDIYKVRRNLEHFPDLKTEVIGKWLWITGDTKKHIMALKMLKCSYCPKKKCWNYHEGKYHKKSKEELTLEEIRHLYID